MQLFSGRERRRAPRTDLTTFCSTAVMLYGIEHQSLMINLSETGARFRVLEPRRTLDMEVGDTLGLTIKTPYGTTECRGVVQWIRDMAGFQTWGVEFISLLTDENDPLRRLLDSSF